MEHHTSGRKKFKSFYQHLCIFSHKGLGLIFVTNLKSREFMKIIICFLINLHQKHISYSV